jgi:DNA-binding LacI/PurR family transcriptional regulator/DNA-binding transcriptional regulator YhcF (GntR family)
VAQSAAFLRGQIDRGVWQEWLPSERSLCEMLQVSRNTLRAALTQLQADGMIRPVHGSGNEIVVSRKASVRTASQDVALLSPEPIERLRPMQTLWIDDMRALLSERGVRLRVLHGPQYYVGNPGPVLEKLVARNPPGCWILMLATEPLQRWFSQNRVPCLVAGSTFAGLDLPFRDLDHRAACRHAAGVLLGLGHRQLAMMMVKSPRAGDLESEAGFMEAVRQSRHPGADARVIYHDETVGGITQAVRRLLSLKPMPTALLVVHPYHYLAVASRLAESGVRVPHDISIISRDDDPFLAFLSPLPARYAANPHVMAKHLLRPMLELLEGNAVTQRAGLIVPQFLKGESVAPPSG